MSTEERIAMQLSELAEMLAKKQALRLLYKRLERFANHVNYCCWLTALERNAGAIDRRIQTLEFRLMAGVLDG